MHIHPIHVSFDGTALLAHLARWKTHSPQGGVLALVPEAERHHVPLLQAAAQQTPLPLCGAIFPALVMPTGFVTTGMWLICFDVMPAHFLVQDLPRTGAPALAKATLAALARMPPVGTDETPRLFLMFDGMLPNIATMLHDTRLLLQDAVLYAGVNAGSETFSPMPCVFDAHHMVEQGAIGMLLPADTPFALKHGYPVSQKLMAATTTTGNRIDTIDHQPAFTVYQQVVQAEYGVQLTRDNFYDLAVHFPFGLITAIDVLVRIPVAFTDDGALICVGEVPPNTLLRLLRAPELAQSDCVSALATGLQGASTDGLLTFYCAGRRMHFGAQATDEILQLHRATGTHQLFGALTLGEIDSMEDLHLPRFHNAAMLCMAIAGPPASA